MNSLTNLEENIQRCVEQINRLRLENERMQQNTEEVRQELVSLNHRDSNSDENKQQIIEKLSLLVTRLESLNIDTIMND